MTLMPEDSCDRLLDGCQTIAAAAEASDATMWEVFAIQSYGREVEIERGRVSLAGGGGDCFRSGNGFGPARDQADADLPDRCRGRLYGWRNLGLQLLRHDRFDLSRHQRRLHDPLSLSRSRLDPAKMQDYEF